MPDGVNRRPRSSAGKNPLWIISLFLSLAEITAGVAATQATGWVQGLLAVFSVVFPVAIGAAFFTFLWKKPFVLYAPGDYSADTPVGAFVDAMTSQQARQQAAVASGLEVAVEQIVARVTANTSLGKDVTSRSDLVEQAVTTARTELANRSIFVDVHEVNPKRLEPIEFVVDERTTVSSLLNFVYFAIADYVGPYKYEEQWILKDAHSGTVYSDMGTVWAGKRSRKGRDERRLSEVGIRPGSRLAAVGFP